MVSGVALHCIVWLLAAILDEFLLASVLKPTCSCHLVPFSFSFHFSMPHCHRRTNSLRINSHL
jgi:hypothetical protein